MHRDLAARNVLLQENNGVLIPKITDFGLTRHVGSDQSGMTKSEVGPLKWMVSMEKETLLK